jgi:hypothetical protein
VGLIGNRGPRLLLILHGRATDSRSREIDRDLNAVGDFDERDAAVHPVFLAVKGHGSGDGAVARASAGYREKQLLGLGDSADGEVAIDLKGGRAGLYDLGRFEGDLGIVLGVEEVLALQLVVLHSAACIDRGRLNLDVQNTGGDISGGEGQGGVPLIEGTCYCD